MAAENGTYVFAIVGANHPCRLAGLTGVGESGAPLRRLDAGSVVAIVSDAPPGLRAKRRDLLTHHRVLAQLSEQGPLLPMRFGVVAPNEKELDAELRREADHHLAMLAQLAGRVEMNVKLLPNEDVLVREAATEDAAVQELRGTVSPDREGQIQLGEAVAGAVKQRERADAERVLATLQPFASQTVEGPDVTGCALNAGFLVDRDNLAKFAERVTRLDAELGDRASLKCTGPIPAYSFVAT